MGRSGSELIDSNSIRLIRKIVMRSAGFLALHLCAEASLSGFRFGINYFEINGFQLEDINRSFLARSVK